MNKIDDIAAATERFDPPSMRALRAFEAASRLGGFTAAAKALNITQSAVSHSVKELEQRLDAALFARRGRRVELTEAGKRYAPFVREALSRLKAGDLAVIDPGRRARILTVSVSPSFAAKWLASKIGDFAESHPDLDLRISAAARHVDFAEDEIDLAVRHGDGDWPGLDCTKLCDERLIPVCSPIFKGLENIQNAEDLALQPLIHCRDADAWRSWFLAVGVAPSASMSRGLVVNEMSLAIDAAASGRGVALARSALATRDLLDGRLLTPVTQWAPASFAYWIVHPKGARQAAKIKRFKSWLIGQQKADEAMLALHAGLRTTP